MHGNERVRYIEELKRHFGADQRRIDHTLKVLAFADMIMDGEGCSAELRKVITITALLHDVGIKAAEQKYNSAAGRYQEIEGPPVVKEIMASNDEPADIIHRVAYIVGGHHTPTKNDGLDFQIIWEADLLVNIEEEQLDRHPDKLGDIIAKNFRTATGRRIASERYGNHRE